MEITSFNGQKIKNAIYRKVVQGKKATNMQIVGEKIIVPKKNFNKENKIPRGAFYLFQTLNKVCHIVVKISN